MEARVLAQDVGFTEGPVITQVGHIVVTSIDRGVVYQIASEGPIVLAVTGGGPNGATEGPAGDIYISQNGGTRPAHRWPDVTGGIQVIRQGGEHVDWVTRDPVAPNDLCFGPDGFLYLTDPTRNGRRDDGRLWRCHIGSGEAELLRSVPWYPNGIGFGLEDDAVYVASTGEHRIWRFPLGPLGLGEGEVFIEMAAGLPDGFAFDVDGNLIVAAVGHDGRPGEIQTYDRSGTLVDAFHPGTHVKYTNVALSPGRKLVITDSDGGAVLAVDGWPHAGLPLHPFRQAKVRA